MRPAGGPAAGRFPAGPRHRRLPGPTEEGGPVDVALDAYELIEQMRLAGCGDGERQAVVLLLRYRSCRRVAVEMRITRAKVVILLRGAAATLAAWRKRRRGLTHAEIMGVYASEVSRLGQVCEHHCLPGEEECGRTGLCTRRWYLFREPTV